MDKEVEEIQGEAVGSAFINSRLVTFGWKVKLYDFVSLCEILQIV